MATLTEDNYIEDRGPEFLSDFEEAAKGGYEAAAYPVVTMVKDMFRAAKDYRRMKEETWIKSYLNFRGLYHKDVKFLTTERSRAFVKITKTKTVAGYGQILDVLFSQGKLPFVIKPTEEPEGVDEVAHIGGQTAPEKPKPQPDPIGFPGDGKDPAPGATLNSRLQELLALPEDTEIQSGASLLPGTVNVRPADIKARKMDKKIRDQITECGGEREIRRLVLEMCMLGTGILKGPYVQRKERPKWDDQGNYTPTEKIMPKVEHVSVWDFYPEAGTINYKNLTRCVQRHKMDARQVRELKLRPYFREQVIEQLIAAGCNYQKEYWESSIEESSIDAQEECWEILEFWGIMAYKDIEKLKEGGFDIKLPDTIKDKDFVHVNAWISGEFLLRLTLNPFKPAEIPYKIVPFEEDIYNIFGVGIPENMEDCQMLMNGFTRMAIDNAVLSGSVLLEVDETYLVPGQSMDIYPGKIFRRSGGPPGQAIFSTNIKNTSNENIQMFELFRRLSDDATGIPSFSHGQTGVQGVGRTSSGISMLLGAASLNIKTVIKNIDDFLIQPFIESMYAFNMNFIDDDSIKGDLEVKAQGTDSLLQKEVKTQRHLQFLQIVSGNPQLMVMADIPYILKQIAEGLDLEPDLVIRDPGLVAAVMASIQAQQQAQAPAGPSPGGMGNPGGGAGIGPQTPAVPGSEQFSGSINPQMDPAQQVMQ